MNPIDKLTELFEEFPGIGPRQARRFVQFLLIQNLSFRTTLSHTIEELSNKTKQCIECFRWFVVEKNKTGLCEICSNQNRDSHMLFVVEKDADITNIEQGGFRGKYFVLGGVIPLAAEKPEKHIRLSQLVSRINTDGAQKKLEEVILGLSATTEGDHTHLIIKEKLHSMAEGFHFKISSLGRGLSTGSELEYADPDTITSALNSRRQD